MRVTSIFLIVCLVVVISCVHPSKHSSQNKKAVDDNYYQTQEHFEKTMALLKTKSSQEIKAMIENEEITGFYPLLKRSEFYDFIESKGVQLQYDEEPVLIAGFEFVQSKLGNSDIASKGTRSGFVLLSMFIDEFGNVNNVEVIAEQPAGESFGQAAVDVAKKSKWKPARLKNKNVPCTIKVPIKYKLK